MSFVWLLLIIGFILAEAFTYQLVSIWFAAGSIGGLITSFFTENVFYQVLVFTVISVIMFALIRPIAKGKLKATGLKTNAENLIGKEIVITEEVDNALSLGQGKINGMIWTVRSDGNRRLEKGAVAVVDRIEGVKLIVKEKE